ncbi:hypothetical protein [Ktedonospora formicarum]|uniref:Uncharacterized protein n=1 Tax=Ktedonospora formicarum TaxID=2778364 RepID=A0A8J3I0R9_9CHLR|nr:hypothetical protein [Ktedonospora formicarum]GHO47867.1 hypothetical protein KSX_60300 [Ktedonospora formicarum]
MSHSSMIKGARSIVLWGVCAALLVGMQERIAIATDTTPAQLTSNANATKVAKAQNGCPVNIGYGTTPISEDGQASIAINGGTSVTVEIEMDTGQASPCKMKVKFSAPSSTDDPGASDSTDNKDNKDNKDNTSKSGKTDSKGGANTGGGATMKGGMPSDSDYDLTPTPTEDDSYYYYEGP